MKEYWPKCCSSPRDPRWQFEPVLSAHYLASPLRAPFRPGTPSFPPSLSPPLSPSLAESFVYSLSPLSGMRWLLGSPLSPPKCFIDELWLLLLFHMSKKVKCRPPWLHFMLLPSKKHKFLPSPARSPSPFLFFFFAYSCTPIFCFCMHTSPTKSAARLPDAETGPGVRPQTRAQRVCFWVRWGVR